MMFQILNCDSSPIKRGSPVHEILCATKKKVQPYVGRSGLPAPITFFVVPDFRATLLFLKFNWRCETKTVA